MRRHFLRLVSGMLLLWVASPLSVVRACGVASDCDVPGGSYRIAMPARADAEHKVGAIVYIHGYQGSPEGVMEYTALRDVADRLGVALIAPRGLNKSWSLPGAFRQRRDEVAFIRAVVDDAVAHGRIDSSRIMISGFSVGGSMTWYVACAEGRHYAGYAPIAGSFWEPYVEGCKLPLPFIYHVHGLSDETVPMEGRSLSVGTQGDTYKSFGLLRRFSGCEAELDGETREGKLTCSRQTCGGAVQQLCLHDGGHSVQPIWIENAWRKLAAANRWP